MILAGVGEIAQQMLNEIPLHFPFAGLDEFVIMPDHIHIIIIINETQKNQKSIDRNDDAITPSSNNNDSLTGIVEPLHATALPLHTMDQRQPSTNIGNGDKNPNNPGETKNMHFSSISPSYGSLATIIRSYKSAVTNRARCIEPSFAWQSKFHDHIIRTNAGLSRIRTYIKNNPHLYHGKSVSGFQC